MKDKYYFLRAVVLILIISLTSANVVFPSDKSARRKEYQIKAAYLYNFLKFTEFTEVNSPDSISEISIVILGEDPFGDFLTPILNKTIQNKPIRISRISSIEEIGNCHLLYISDSRKDSLSSTFEQLSESNILTVGETSTFTQQGGMIGFFINDGSVKFEINLTAANHASIKFRSQLLSVARIVNYDKTVDK